jgi:hypothetical protein
MPRIFVNETQKRAINFFLIFTTLYFLAGIVSDPAFAVTVEKLQEPIANLKTEIFSGWMMVVKICAATAGIVISAFKGSLAPFGIGAGLSAGIHLYDSYLGTGADGALI